ncbi:DHBP synthase RibB-like alpha/beta domain-containing protein [Rhexocercosporidium sp. MPI-PUGE-AT-0058]|nr:DHBP synthase RibB-like alpha/beta domain-containing protein [Rhexocercosporidium sp. MPI-PUGE-AT-0058]
MASSTNGTMAKTHILHVNIGNLGKFKDGKTLETWELPTDTKDLQPLQEAATHLREGIIPVGFPTETVYGLGADATRSQAVKGIYKAKGRPSDNPLIIHVCDLTMLRSLIAPAEPRNGNTNCSDPIPAIYRALIERFWPGPLTILLPNPKPSKLAPEVTAGLPTFGARMPDSPLALSLIHLAGVPLAAPSANASTKPSPTTAEHVRHDLNGKVEIILDGGPCLVGVESTVVDGMCDPPVVLRPGGVSIDRIRECEGWARVVKAYKDASEEGSKAPRAPGMKYKHYSPKAKVVLYEAMPKENAARMGIRDEPSFIFEAQVKKLEHLGYEALGRPAKIGIVRTKNWADWAGFQESSLRGHNGEKGSMILRQQVLQTSNSFSMQQGELWCYAEDAKSSDTSPEYAVKTLLGEVIDISLGKDTKEIAHGLFSSLRELDLREVDVVYVEGIEDEGDIAAAVMNRLRKAATKIEV